jgi:hypothetical protein
MSFEMGIAYVFVVIVGQTSKARDEKDHEERSNKVIEAY